MDSFAVIKKNEALYMYWYKMMSLLNGNKQDSTVTCI